MADTSNHSNHTITMTTENHTDNREKKTKEAVPYQYRCRLPVPMISRNDFSVWSILKQCIGKELSKITMPVVFNEPLSFLQRVVEYMEYGSLLKMAASCDDPIERMEYVAAFAVSSSASNWDRVGKPFNPMLGETYELDREDLGFRVVCEQVSHHPPVSAFHVESPDYTFQGAIHPKLKFWGKSVEVTPKGIVTLNLLKYDESYSWQQVNCCVHNIIVGTLWIEHYGTMEIVNNKNKQKCVLNFKPSGWFGKDLHKVEGYIYDNNKKKVRALYGKWIDALFSVDVPTYEGHLQSSHSSTNLTKKSSETDGEAPDPKNVETLPTGQAISCNLHLPGQKQLWQAEPKPSETNKYYSFTLFAMMLNEMQTDIDMNLPPTDSRLRPDMRKLEEGDLEGAAAEKHRMEEKQRGSRKERKRTKDDWAPSYFTHGTNPMTGKDDWLYNGRYWTKDWSGCEDIF